MSDPVSQLIGLTLNRIEGCLPESNEVTFYSECGQQFRMYHEQACCEFVELHDVEGDVADLIGTPIVVAEMVSNAAQQALNLITSLPEMGGECEQWTFYRLATTKGWVVLRWYGDSNGYYSTDVDFKRITN